MQKYIILFMIGCLSVFELNAQIVGGRSNGQSTPSEVKASEVNAGGFSGDVSLFTGTYNSSYTLGSVSTPSGIGFTATMTYSTAFSSGDNLPHLAGVPYGEGWSVDLPSITVSNEDYNKYTAAQLAAMNDPQNSGQQQTPLFTEPNNSCNDARDEGKLFFYAPKLNIPGVGSGRMVYKYKTNQGFLFVLHKFEQCIEAYFRGGDWEIVLDDGTRYYMSQAVISHRNASNQRVQAECVGDDDNIAIGNLILPKTEVVSWYCTKINHPNKSGNIRFEYEPFGCHDYFKEIIALDVNSATSYFSTTNWTDPAALPEGRKVCKEIIIKNITTGYQQLNFDYESISTADGDNLLDINDPNVNREDSMYSSTVVYDFSKDGLGFNNWKRYRHMKSDAIGDEDINMFNLVNMRPTNPYVGSYEGLPTGGNPHPYYWQEDINTNECWEGVPFDHSFLESGRIGGGLDNSIMPAGDLYEIKTRIKNGDEKYGLFDINLATGYNLLGQPLASDGELSVQDPNVKLIRQECFNLTRGESVFSTFNQALKWVDLSSGNGEETTTSNLFVMPNLPSTYNGFNIQIGPAISDNKFNMHIADMVGAGNCIPDLCNSYYNHIYTNPSTNPELKSGDPIPNNFGIGIPWYMTRHFYNAVFPGLNYCPDSPEPSQFFWWNDGYVSGGAYGTCEEQLMNTTNRPTQADENNILLSAEIIRYAKNPYMLKTVTFQVFNPENEISTIEDHWKSVNQLSFDYEISQTNLWVNEIACDDDNGNADQQIQKIGNRNIVKLVAISSTPVNTSNGSGGSTSGNSITRFNYQEIDLEPFNIVGMPSISTNFQHNSNYVILSSIIDPLGKEISISYNDEATYRDASFRYNLRPNEVIVSGDNCGVPSESGCDATGRKKRDRSYAYQTFLVVDEIKVQERDGAEKFWKYDFSGFSTMDDRTPLTKNMTWDDILSRSNGFSSTTVHGPSPSAGSGPRVEYSHYVDDMFWGKVQSVASFDENGTPLSSSSNSYESVLAFENPMLRMSLASGLMEGQYWDYSVWWEGDRPKVEDFNSYGEYLESPGGLYEWMEAEVDNPAYTTWLNNEPIPPFDCFDDSWYENEANQNEVVACDEFINEYNNWLNSEPSQTQVPFYMFERESPNMLAAAGMYDAADFYESNHFREILKSNPTYLNSYFIKKTRESSTTYDFDCESKGSPVPVGVTSSVQYEYWDASYDGTSKSSAYEALGLNKNSAGVYQLNWEPSWKVYSKRTVDGGSGVETFEENFYMHDFINKPEYQVGGSYVAPNPNFVILWDNFSFKHDRSSVVQTRVTSSSLSDGPKTRSTYYTYAYGDEWEIVAPAYKEVVIDHVPQDCNGTTSITGQTSNQEYPIYTPPPNGSNSGNGPENDPNGGVMYYPDQPLASNTYLKSVVEQVEEGVNDLISYDPTDNFKASFGVETLTTYNVLSRNNFGQVAQEENEKGLITEFDYGEITILKYLECKYHGLGWSYQPLQRNVGLPVAVTVGLGLPNALTTTYDYNLDNSIEKVTDPNGIELSYEYDAFGRMTKAYRNNQLIQESAYSNWANTVGSNDSFKDRAKDNSVSTTNYLDGSTSFSATAYVDPLGRKVATNKYSEGETIGVEDNIFDIYNRPILKSPPGTVGPTVNKDFTTNQTSHTAFIYDIAPRSRPLKASKFGESINGNHTVDYSYCLASANDLTNQLNLAGQTMIPPGGPFFKTQTTDEDGKTVLEYSNSAGQKVATITEIAPGVTAATTFLYNSFGSVMKVSNPKNQISEYRYNYLGQLYEKLTVDGGLTKYSYNPSGQLAVEQDAILAGGHGRLYHYDEFGRMTHQVKMVVTPGMGVFDNDGNTWIGDADKWAIFDYFLSGGSNKTEKRWMYDSFDPSFNYAPNALDYLNNSLSNTKGNLVQTVSYNLSDNPIEFKFLSYNNDGFLKWEMTQFNQNGMNNGPGMVIRMDYPEYNLQGSNLIQNIDLDGDHTLDFQYVYEYDNWNRIENVYANYDNSGTGGNLIVNYKYDDAKGVVEERRYYHSEIDDTGAILCKNEEMELTIYSYDDRIRLEEINSQFFEWELLYDANTIGTQDENFNGNINATKATYKLGGALNPPTSFADESQYAYTYDGMNRLIQADAELKENGLVVAPTWGNTSYTYDKIGNFSSLNRITKIVNTTTIETTDYTYHYQAGNNKLTEIFKPGPGGLSSSVLDRSISYDGNGNLLTDTKRQITSTSYGRANLPWTQSVAGNNNQYLYDINDARIYKLGVQLDVRGATTVSEFYLRDAGGRELAIYNFNTNKLSWFVHGNERVAKIDHHSDYEFDTPTEPPCQCDPRTDPRCRDKIIRGAGFYDKNQINLSDANNTRLINLANSLVDCNDGSTYGTPPGTDLSFYNATIHYVTKVDQSEDYVKDDDLGNLQAGYAIEGTIQINSRHQQFMMTLNNGQEVPVSIEEMLTLGDPSPPNTGYTGTGDPYLVPLDEMLDAPPVSASYYIHDHLGNTRIVYHYSCHEDVNIQGYTLEHVMDYYPYGKMLQEYKYGTALSERYLTTHHERDVESGLDYRGARFYDSDIGRFLSLDPLAIKFADVSPYNYVLCNPTHWVDKDGRAPTDPIIKKLNSMSKAANKRFRKDYKRGFNRSKTRGRERGFRFVQKRNGKFKIRGRAKAPKESGGVVTVRHPLNSEGKVASAGDGHTHVVGSKDFGTGQVEKGVSFSGADIAAMGNKKQNGFVSMIETGSDRQALVVEDAATAQEFISSHGGKEGLSNKVDYRTAELAQSGMSMADASKQAVYEIIGDSKESGIKFYTTSTKDKTKFKEFKK